MEDFSIQEIITLFEKRYFFKFTKEQVGISIKSLEMVVQWDKEKTYPNFSRNFSLRWKVPKNEEGVPIERLKNTWVHKESLNAKYTVHNFVPSA